MGAMNDETDICRDIGGKCQAHDVEAAIAKVAGRQHGVISRDQLRRLGLGDDAVNHRIRTKRLLSLYCSVYAVGHRNRSRESAWMAAVLAGGQGTVLSNRPAGAAWALCSSAGRVEVTVPRQKRPHPRILFHHAVLPADERTTLNGIPITTVPRTLLDLASTLDERQLERAINEAEIKRLWDELSLHDLLHRYRGRAGTKLVRAALRKRTEGATATKSDLEELFIRFADKAGLPRPETNTYVEGLEVDCVWRPQRVVIEVDSWEVHRTRGAFERDREKSRILQAAGWRCVPVTYLQLTRGSAEVARDVRRLLGLATLAA
jgi:very-short-patch-repair endonuclease